MIRVAVIAVLVALSLTAGLAFAARRNASAPPPAPAVRHYVPTPPTAEQLAFRKRYLAAILRGDPAVNCNCNAGARAKQRAQKIAAAKAAASRVAAP